MKYVLKILALVVFIAAQTAFAAAALERILRYESVMSVARDSSATITERITFNIEGRDIERGIIRFFPVRYREAAGVMRRTGFDLLSVSFDGKDIPYQVSRKGNYAEIKIGDPAARIPRGEHTYELVFRVTGHVRFLKDMDAIYYNVTGNLWEFPIDYANFRLELPAGGEKIIASNAYTGYTGESGADFRSAGHVFFETTRALREKEGFTVAVDWEKGLVEPPPLSAFERFVALLFGNRIFAAGLLPLLVLSYFMPMWLWLGREPALGTVYPIFDAPKDIEPGLTAVVHKMKIAPECLTSNLTQLAVLGHLKFGFVSKDAAAITKTSKPLKPLPKSLSVTWNKLFPTDEVSSVSFSSKRAHNKYIGDAYRGTIDHYRKYEDRTWLLNEDVKIEKLYKRNLPASGLGFVFFAVCLFFLSDYYPAGALSRVLGERCQIP